MEDNFDLEKIVAELEQERDRLNQAIALLKERNFPASTRKTDARDGRGSVARRAADSRRSGEGDYQSS